MRRFDLGILGLWGLPYFVTAIVVKMNLLREEYV